MSISLSTLRGHILTMKMKWISALTAKLVRWRCNSVELNLLLCFHSHMHSHTQLQTHTVTCLLTHLHMCTRTHTHSCTSKRCWLGFSKAVAKPDVGYRHLYDQHLWSGGRKSKTEQELNLLSLWHNPPCKPNRQHRETLVPRGRPAPAWHPHTASGSTGEAGLCTPGLPPLKRNMVGHIELCLGVIEIIDR